MIGSLSIKDYFKFKNRDKEEILKQALKPVQFIPETLHVDDLFKSMQKSRNHFSVVVDEYGGVDGIVTMSDLLEELVGDLEDDMTAPPSCPDIEKVSRSVWRIKGAASRRRSEQMSGNFAARRRMRHFRRFCFVADGQYSGKQNERET